MTTPADIDRAQKHIAPTRRVAIGMGYDVHALMPAGEKQSIRLGGIDIPNAHALHGHSDADVVLHAIVDALLGSVAEGDIGSHFPPSDERWKGADSAMFIEQARARVAAHGGVIQHLDITIIGEQPKVSPYRDAMRQTIATLLQLPLQPCEREGDDHGETRLHRARGRHCLPRGRNRRLATGECRMKRACLSTMYGVGLVRIGPGTAGSFVAMLIAYPILLLPNGYVWLTLGAVFSSRCSVQ